jgi:hypothetical protein
MRSLVGATPIIGFLLALGYLASDVECNNGQLKQRMYSVEVEETILDAIFDKSFISNLEFKGTSKGVVECIRKKIASMPKLHPGERIRLEECEIEIDRIKTETIKDGTQTSFEKIGKVLQQNSIKSDSS